MQSSCQSTTLAIKFYRVKIFLKDYKLFRILFNYPNSNVKVMHQTAQNLIHEIHSEVWCIVNLWVT